MLDKVKEDLINIWSNALELIEEGEFEELSGLSNHTIHNSSIYGDEFSISAAVIIYSLAKMEQRGKINSGHVTGLITKLLQSLSEADEKQYRKTQKAFFEYIQGAEAEFDTYITAVLQEAKLKKSWKVYDHGLSLGASANLLGVSHWELMNYVGNTKVADVIKTDVRSRLEFARRLFT